MLNLVLAVLTGDISLHLSSWHVVHWFLTHSLLLLRLKLVYLPSWCTFQCEVFLLLFSPSRDLYSFYFNSCSLLYLLSLIFIYSFFWVKKSTDIHLQTVFKSLWLFLAALQRKPFPDSPTAALSSWALPVSLLHPPTVLAGIKTSWEHTQCTTTSKLWWEPSFPAELAGPGVSVGMRCVLYVQRSAEAGHQTPSSQRLIAVWAEALPPLPISVTYPHELCHPLFHQSTTSFVWF